MQRNSMGAALAHAQPDQSPAKHHVRTALHSAGFFTLPIALAVLAASALLAGAGGAFEGAESASAATTSQPATADAQPIDEAKASGAKDVVASEAPAHASNSARGAGNPVQ